MVSCATPHLLPLVREEHAPLYSTSGRAYLCRSVSFYRKKSPEDRAALIRAIGQVGDAQALTLMESILEEILDKEWTTNRYDGLENDVRDAINTLNARLRRERVSETLLRASVAPVDAPETLLRPAANTATESAELLRGANKETTGETDETVPISQKICE